MAGKWPATVYDYARGEVVHEELVDVDVEGGRWVRCPWYNAARSCDVQLGSNIPFVMAQWERHKKSAAHVARMKARENGTSVRDSPEYADFAAAMMESIEKDTDYLVFYRKQLQQRAKEEVQTKELIQKMALLVTEQQEDVESLRNEVDGLRCIVEDLRDEMNAMARENARLRRRDDKTQRQPSRFIEIIESDVEMTPVKARSRSTSRLTRAREIDMFDEDLQLMQLD